ncbi:L-amino acid N-acyltransferase YncA [Desulfacinum hydrothermale DSM 13146]|uniref:L-amino acid N-acyltransferase YncA n=1 Tax=Desulfacinum hydrothermale DSM 13146 TaxID=1121390 RepID=A0A1W1XP25_9BACT|nr:GNAT family N-acetyltransferase [Desulfacinum hydrothermale]SMC25268.1 L-amino acid N-acyltransferase YncA [Desulfacinum hydrothermale DSM 13146]
MNRSPGDRPQPKECVLNNGEVVTLRFLTGEDEEAVRAFFHDIPDHEVEGFREQVPDPRTVSRWIRRLDYDRVTPLAAWSAQRAGIVGLASLNRMVGAYRHVAEVYVVVGTDYRKLGLGSSLIKELVEIATLRGLYFLKAKVLTENQLALRAFRQLGFEVKATLEDYFMTMDGKTKDVALMLKRLRFHMEEDFFYVF